MVDGTVVNPDIPGTEEGTASPGYSFRSPSDLSPADFVHTDDVIIPARACVGWDCISGEDFGSLGYKTLTLKQSTLRIQFEDTSTSLNTPTNGWQITINDPFYGGAEYFSITDLDGGTAPFKMEAGAPDSSLYIDDEGHIGIGTSIPHSYSDLYILAGYYLSIRLEQSGGAESEQIWDIVNENSFFISDKSAGTFPFWIHNDVPSYSLYMARISGNIGMGTQSPDSALNILTGSNMVTPQPDTVLHLENDDEEGYGTDLTITAAADKSSRIHFARPEDPDAGGIYYSHTTDNFTFVAAGATRMQLGPGVGTLPEVEVFGDLSITGSLSKGGGGFKIDHPLEPDKKYLHHSFVESPDMKNVYDGNVELDDKGEAWIQMPDYFEALNREFRYQLTPIGGPAPSLFVAEKISDNRFTIAGGPAELLVSWMVTGVRKDTWAQANHIQVEESKSRN